MEGPSMRKNQTNDKLNLLFQDLQQEWHSIKQAKTKFLPRVSTDSLTPGKALWLLDNSPRILMSSLQDRRAPSVGEAWEVRYKDLATEEIIRERKAAIESGKLKGRRLFEGVERGTEVGFGGTEDIKREFNELDREIEVTSVLSYDSDDEKEVCGSNEALSPACCRCSSCISLSKSSSSSSASPLCSENADNDLAMVIVEEKRLACHVGDEKARWRVVMGFFIIALTVCAVSIISVRCSDGYGVDKVTLVPT